MPDVTLLRKSLEAIKIVCGINCSLNVGADHFNGSTKLADIRIQKAGLTNIEWLPFLRRSVGIVSIDNNKIATLAPVYGIRFERLAYLNLNHNYITAVNLVDLVLPRLQNVYFENNQISYFNFTCCEINGSSRILLSINFLGNPLNCCAPWQWLSSYVKFDYEHISMPCGQRNVRLRNTYDMRSWDCEAQQWQPLIRLVDVARSARPECHESKMKRHIQYGDI